MNRLKNMFMPQTPVILGRWRLKHNDLYCDWWAYSLNPDPGYPNSYIKINSLKSKLDENNNLLDENKKNLSNSRGDLWLQFFRKIK